MAGHDSAETGKFTTLTPGLLRESMTRLEGICTVATVNEDGTANAGIFIPMMPDEDHVVITLARNRTRENITRTTDCVITYTVLNPEATSKMERYRGARLRLQLMTAQDEGYAEVAAAWPQMNMYTMVFKIVDYMQIG